MAPASIVKQAPFMFALSCGKKIEDCQTKKRRPFNKDALFKIQRTYSVFSS